MEHVWCNVDGLAHNLVGPTSIVPDARSHGTDVSLGHRDGLAVIERLDGGEEGEILLNEVGKLGHVNTALLGCDLTPGPLEGLACGSDGNINILLSGLGHRGDDFLRSWVDDLKGLLVNTLNPLIVDEPDAIVSCHELHDWYCPRIGGVVGYEEEGRAHNPVGCL